MSNVQLEAFGELFNSNGGKNRYLQRIYNCPFDSRIIKCDKPNTGTIKYGNCSAQVGTNKRIICPRRFYENNFNILKDIKNFIWGRKPKIDCYDEMGIRVKTDEGETFHYGNLDWLLVKKGYIEDFCGVEIQTDATTGTGAFAKAIEDLKHNKLRSSYNFGLNTLASFKGFLPQFIFKGQLFDDWKKPYCAVFQDELFDKFVKKFRIRYREINNYNTETFLFFIYELLLNSTNNRYGIKLKKVYSSRWIDLLFSFSVESDLLIDFTEIKNKIQNKISSSSPILRL